MQNACCNALEGNKVKAFLAGSDPPAAVMGSLRNDFIGGCYNVHIDLRRAPHSRFTGGHTGATTTHETLVALWPKTGFWHCPLFDPRSRSAR